jgi:hypothetical protein
MVTHKDIRLRQAIWSEYRLGNEENQALANICKKFGTNSVSLSTIHNWYGHFQTQTSPFNENTPQNKLTPVIQKLPNGDEVRKLIIQLIEINFLEGHD